MCNREDTRRSKHWADTEHWIVSKVKDRPVPEQVGEARMSRMEIGSQLGSGWPGALGSKVKANYRDLALWSIYVETLTDKLKNFFFFSRPSTRVHVRYKSLCLTVLEVSVTHHRFLFPVFKLYGHTMLMVFCGFYVSSYQPDLGLCTLVNKALN